MAQEAQTQARRIKVIDRPNMQKYGTIFEVEINGVRLVRKDGSPRRFASKQAAYKAGEVSE